MIIGAQFYTLRDSCKTLEDFSESLKKVADMGYKAVQVSGTCAFEGEWLRDELKKNGLICPVTHTKFDDITDNTEATVAKHKIFDCSYIGLGAAPGLGSGIDVEGFLKKAVPAAKKIKEAGLKFCYHNHWQEFVRHADGIRYIEAFCDAIPPEEMGIILDTYWVQYAGGDPVAWIRELKGRLNCVHFKDMTCAGKEQHRMMPVGEGNLNWKDIIAACADAGTEYAFVEQDDCNGEDPFDCMKRSYEFLKAQGLE